MSKSKSNEPKLTHPRSVRIDLAETAIQACLDYVKAQDMKRLYQSRPEASEQEQASDLQAWVKWQACESKAVDRMRAIEGVLKLSK